jgi:hypothetical protein
MGRGLKKPFPSLAGNSSFPFIFLSIFQHAVPIKG